MKRTWIVSLLVWMLAVCALVVPAAAETIDTEQICTLTVELTDGGTPAEGFPFALYYVASASSEGAFTLAGDFRGCPVELNGLTQEQYADLARTLDAYAQGNRLTPLGRRTTGKDGSACFDDLETGLYLVRSSSAALNGKSYAVDAFLVSLPSRLSDGALAYQVISQPKHVTSTPTETTVSRRVLKLWQGDVEEFRPESVTVSLLRDGEVYDTVVLSKAISWRYSWNDLPEYGEDGHLILWQLTEDVPDGYRVSLGQEGEAFLLTNTYVPDTSTVSRRVQKRWDDAGYTSRRPSSVTVELYCDSQLYDTVTLSTENGWRYIWENLPAKDSVGRPHTWTLREQPVGGYESAIQEEGDTFLVRNSYKGKKLPQTGQLWWPVPVLVCGGLALLAAGLFLKKRQRHG